MMKDLTTEIYKDAASPAVSEVGKVAGRSVKALLSPIRGFLWCWEKIEEYVEQAVQKNLEGVPEERLKSPEPEIAVLLSVINLYSTERNSTRNVHRFACQFNG